MKIPITDQFLLDILQVTGDMAGFLLSPTHVKTNRFFGWESPVFEKYRQGKNRQRFSQLIYYLKRKNLIKVKSLEGKQAVMLTKEGLQKALAAKWMFEERQKRRDGKWIMVAFDMPQNHKKARSLLRSILKNLGYVLFQQSLWVTAYDVSAQTESLLQMHDLERYVKIFLIEKLQ